MARVLAVALFGVCTLLPSLPALAGHRGHSPRGGGVFGAMAAAARQQAAWLQKEWAAELKRRAKNNQERMRYADEARKEGKPRLAATLYLRVALQRPKDKNAGAAKAALKSMANEGRAEMKKADELLSQNRIIEAFDKLDYLAWAYEEVPEFNSEIKSHVQKLHRDPNYESVLKERPAADLFAAAQKQESDGERCCAYWTYEEAAKLAPAPSAVKAAERFEAMKKDPEIVAEAEECRLLQECHQTFHSAELLEKSLPNKAEELFNQILAKAPHDSEVYKCAKEEIAKLHAPKKK
ncbi:MAG TPA: hypothetical protein VFI31_20220 [Pirellulales bacterium]|nr:hypothetical protein [Pirellulales bacterium]